MAPGIQGTYDHKEFSVVDVVVPFSWSEHLRKVGTWVPVTIGISLEEHTSRDMLRGVGEDRKGSGEVREMKYWVRNEGPLEDGKGGITGFRPIPGVGFLSEVKERTGDIGVVGYESVIEIGKAQEGMDIFDNGWSQLIGNSSYFDMVHCQGPGLDDHAQVFYFLDSEGTFLQFEVEVQFLHMLENSLFLCLVFSIIVGED